MHGQRDCRRPTELIRQDGEVLHDHVAPKRSQSAVQVRNPSVRKIVRQAIQCPFCRTPNQRDPDTSASPATDDHIGALERREKVGDMLCRVGPVSIRYGDDLMSSRCYPGLKGRAISTVASMPYPAGTCRSRRPRRGIARTIIHNDDLAQDPMLTKDFPKFRYDRSDAGFLVECGDDDTEGLRHG